MQNVCVGCRGESLTNLGVRFPTWARVQVHFYKEGGVSSLRVTKFLLDYLVGSGLTFLLLFLLVGNVTVLDTSTELGIAYRCSDAFPRQEVFKQLEPSLNSTEACEVVSPCEEAQKIQCSGTLKLYQLPQTFLLPDRLDIRVKNALAEPYGVYSYTFGATRRFSLNTLFALIIFSVFITEAGAVVFALWRQNSLATAFSLGPGGKKAQLLSPVLYAVFWSVFVIVMNRLVYGLFDHPGIEQSELLKGFSRSLPGIFFAVFLAPFAEELMFRGVFLRFFIEKGRATLGLILVSVGFALLHGFSETSLAWQIYTSSTFFAGSVILCLLYIRGKSLWPPIIFHSAYNVCMLAYFNVHG